MEIHTKDKDMRKILRDGKKEIDKAMDRTWSEYELRLLIQDEMSCKDNEIERLIKKIKDLNSP